MNGTRTKLATGTNTTDAARRGAVLPLLAGAGIASLAFLAGSGAFVPTAEAGPPAPNARTMAQRALEAQEVKPFDAAQQRADMNAELRALRDEVASLRTMLSSGSVRVEIANIDDLKIDYAKLREALRAP
jgi:hypothetical protein